MNKNQREAYFTMSMAYLEVGEFASKQDIHTHEYDNAVAYQLYHSLELFLKYAILKKQGSVNKIHDLSELLDKYNSLYPDDSCRIKHPFDLSKYESDDKNFGERELFEKHILKFSPKYMDQHLRYPPDFRTGGYSYKLDSEYFQNFKEIYLDLYQKINC